MNEPEWPFVGLEYLKKKVDGIAKFPVNILIQGESGTGKSELARYIHEQSGLRYSKKIGLENLNKEGKLCKMLERNGFSKDSRDDDNPTDNSLHEISASQPEGIVEGELFGYVKGAFTSASEDGQPGAFLAANQGTLFIDEIADCPKALQYKLLTVIQPRKGDGLSSRYVRPVGQTEDIRVDVRLITATNKDLWQEVENGNFRKDLYYRLAGYVVKTPTFNELAVDDRKKIIVEQLKKTTEKLWEQDKQNMPKKCVCEGSDKGQNAMEALLSYPFPGNVRELQNALMHAVIEAYLDQNAPKDIIQICNKHLPEKIRDCHSSTVAKNNWHDVVDDLSPETKVCLDDLERIGWCTEKDWEIILELDGFHFNESAVTAMAISPLDSKVKRRHIASEDIRELAYLVWLLKRDRLSTDEAIVRMFKGESPKKSEKNHGDQTCRTLLEKFGITYPKLRDGIRNLYWGGKK